MSSNDDNSIRAGFSFLLKRYRREVRGWTQKELATRSGLKLRTIQDLETAQKAKLDHETISKLADVFELGEKAKEEFYSVAGLSIVNPTSDEIEWRKLIYDFYKSIDFPAFVSDELFEIRSMNSYIMELLEINVTRISEILHTTGSFNAIRFFLDPEFNTKKLYGHEWKTYTTLQFWFFRNLSRPYIHTARYQKLLAEFQKLGDFEELWKASEDFPMPLPPYPGAIHHHKYGTVRFWHSSSVKPNIKGEQMTFLFYHPADAESERAFAQIRQDVPKMAYQLSDTRGKGIVRLF